ncbi:hypothetical protein NPIL_7021 [Nephila pilipes]|uniref:Uncharacterized protein n=1 Tax=Nephila pilipes TaxID=299642 RepID=A0A8X6NUX3_NEPPI|nr:hypothetical protein NPIL_7021 [Nephila pilipes]
MVNVPIAGKFQIQNKAQILRLPDHQKSKSFMIRLHMSALVLQMTISSAKKAKLPPSRDDVFSTTQGEGEKVWTQNRAPRKFLAELKTSGHSII